LQGFLSAMPQLDPEVGVEEGCKEKEFNLATESYGGVCASLSVALSSY
jgi:hypothetical protein